MLDDPEELAIRLGVLLLMREEQGKQPMSRLAVRAVLSNEAGRTITRAEMNRAARRLGLRVVVVRDERKNIQRSAYRLPLSLSRLTLISDALQRQRMERESGQ